MGWLIAGLVSMTVIGLLWVFARRWEPRRPSADSARLTDLLGRPEPRKHPPASPPPTSQLSPPLLPRPSPPPVPRPAPPLLPRPSPPPAPQPPARTPDGPPDDGDWLADQLEWISTWSERMQERIIAPGQPQDPPPPNHQDDDPDAR